MHYIAFMVQESSPLSGAIGARVRQQRSARGWTLDRLAEQAQVSRRQLVNIEQGTANPSISTLLRVSAALGIGLPDLVQEPDSGDVRITRAGEGPALWTGPDGGEGVLVSTGGGPHVIELWDWSLAEGEQHSSAGNTPGTRELVHVHQGQLQVVVGDQSHDLATGDAISFPGDVPHGYRNPAGLTARFSLVVFEPRPGGTHG